MRQIAFLEPRRPVAPLGVVTKGGEAKDVGEENPISKSYNALQADVLWNEGYIWKHANLILSC